MMRLVTYGITDVSANLTSIPPTHHPGLLWGSADFEVSTAPRDGRFIITWTFPDDEKRVSKVEVKAIPGRRVRHRGWERLRIHGDEHEFRAYRLFERSSSAIILFRVPDTANFLSQIPDDTPLGGISLPGTHDSCALYGFPVSQCQQPSTPIMQQLLDGMRFLDVRLRVVGDELLMYHGPRPQRSSLPILLSVLHSFLTSHPTETLLLSLKEETPPFHPRFSALVYAVISPFLSHSFLEGRIPTLGEVRGKGILLTRFDRMGEGEWVEGMGVHPYTWPDSRRDGFEWWCGGTRVRTQDWYRVKSFLEIPEKFEVITNHLTPTITNTESPPPFSLSYTSASDFPLSLPTVMAKGFGWPEWGLGVRGINDRLIRWLLERIAAGERVRGCCAMDFYHQNGARDADGAGLAELLVLMNFLD